MPRVMDAGGVRHDVRVHDPDTPGFGRTACGTWVTWAISTRAHQLDLEAGAVAVVFKPPRSTVSCLWCMARIVRA